MQKHSVPNVTICIGSKKNNKTNTCMYASRAAIRFLKMIHVFIIKHLFFQVRSERILILFFNKCKKEI